MSTSSPRLTRTNPIADGRIVPDKRRHTRHELPLLGRFMRANKQEFPCKLDNISVGGAAVMAPVELEIGERVIAYFDEIGGLEGVVTRLFEGGFAMRIQASAHKRDKLAAHITWLINKQHINGIEARRHQRVMVPNKNSTLKFSDGTEVACQILDVSLSGASVATDARPTIGTEVTFGKMRARVMRYHDRGLGVQFLDIPDKEALRRYMG